MSDEKQKANPQNWVNPSGPDRFAAWRYRDTGIGRKDLRCPGPAALSGHCLLYAKFLVLGAAAGPARYGMSVCDTLWPGAWRSKLMMARQPKYLG